MSNRFKQLRKRYPRTYVTKEQNKKLPSAGWKVSWHKWWFRSRYDDWKDGLKNWKSYTWFEFKRNVLWSHYYWGTMRGANFREIYIGPLLIIFPRRWIVGPARTFHPEVFDD